MPTAPPTPKIKLAKATTIYTDSYSHSGVQRFIQWILDGYGISQFELSKRSGLSPATIFQILNKQERQTTRPPRRSTLMRLAQALAGNVVFNSRKNEFAVLRSDDVGAETKDLTLLFNELAAVLVAAGKVKLTEEERKRIVRVVKAVL